MRIPILKTGVDNNLETPPNQEERYDFLKEIEVLRNVCRDLTYKINKREEFLRLFVLEEYPIFRKMPVYFFHKLVVMMDKEYVKLVKKKERVLEAIRIIKDNKPYLLEEDINKIFKWLERRIPTSIKKPSFREIKNDVEKFIKYGFINRKQGKEFLNFVKNNMKDLIKEINKVTLKII